MTPHPPAYARALLHWFCSSDWLEEIEGDLYEQYQADHHRYGPRRAHVYYWFHLLRFVRPYVLRRNRPTHASLFGPIMLKNYLTIALRTFRKNTGYTAINITSLAVGLACCLLIMLYVQHERSYDRFHMNGDRIYRVFAELRWGDQVHEMARSPHPLGPTLAETVSEITAAVRLQGAGELVVSRNNQRFRENRFLFADPNVLDVFSFTLQSGDPATALTDPNSILLTASTAAKYFGTADPIGETLDIDRLGSLRVAGILDDVPENSHLQFDALLSYTFLAERLPMQMAAWDNFVTSTYLLAAPHADETVLVKAIARFVEASPHASGSVTYGVDAFQDIYLHTYKDGDLGTGSDVRYLYLFSAIAAFILLIACLTFVSLATARASERQREVGLRKVLGAHRLQLTRQFLTEALLLTLVASGLALLLAHLAFPAFNTISGKPLSFPHSATFWLAFIGLTLGIGLVAGSYPAFALASFSPKQGLYGAPTSLLRGQRFRSALVVVQFSLSLGFMVSALVMADQLQYLQTKDLGFNQDQVVTLRMPPALRGPQMERAKHAFSQHPNVLQAAASYHTPGAGRAQYFSQVEGLEKSYAFPTYIVDTNYLDVMEMDMVAGRAFSEALTTDATAAFIVNEAAVAAFGWKEPLGKRIRWDQSKEGAVIGVVRDFHIVSLHAPIEPLVLHVDPSYFRQLSLRIRAEDVRETLSGLETIWASLAPDQPFRFAFLDDTFAAHYQSEQRILRLVDYATLLAIFIACLGLFGLAAFTAQRRMKEIGIRKVMGATVTGLVMLQTRVFARLVFMAFVLATPLAYLAMQRWLTTFAYQTDVQPRLFVLAGAVLLLLTLVTVSVQTLKAARANPVDVLRHD